MARRRKRRSAGGDGGAARPAPRRSPRTALRSFLGTGRRRALLAAAAGLFGVLGIVVVLLYLVFGKMRGPTRGGGVEVDWPAGLGSDEAAALLAQLGVVKSRDAMAVFLRATGGTAGFAPGPHLLPDGATPWELRRLLARSADRPRAKVVVPEGYNRFDIAARLEKLGVAGAKAFLASSADPALLDEVGVEHAGAVGAESAEGYLFPATYDLHVDTDPGGIVRRMVKEGDKRWLAIAAQRADALASLRGTLGWGRREVLTIASMIEKEAAVDEERPMIASVFLNRLLDPDFKPKRLQSDPTAIYGCLVAPDEAPSCADFKGKATPAINGDAKNRYSTYVRPGLPPGPISNPGVRSIEAVLAPSPTRFLYFVAAGGGRHTFSESFGAHNDAVKKLRATAQGGEPR